jgi:hypothetical protein
LSELALERFGEGTKEGMVSFAYPLLENALADGHGGEGAQNESPATGPAGGDRTRGRARAEPTRS